MKIFDNSAIILFLEYLDKEKCLHFLSRDGYHLIIPESVCNEFEYKDFDGKLDIIIEEMILKKYEGMSTSIEDSIKNRYPILHDGEINVLSWGTQFKKLNKKFWCILDEKKGRKAAEELGLPVKGSIGLLKLLKDNKTLDNPQMINIVEKIRKSPFHISDEILRSLLE